MQSNIYVDCSHTDFEGGHGSDASEQSFRSVHDDATSAVSRDEYQDCCSPIVHDGAESESSSARADADVSLNASHRVSEAPVADAAAGENCNELEDAIEDPEVLLKEAEAAKASGNELFKNGEFIAAIERYDEALTIAPPQAKQRAVYFANRGACHLALQNWQGCVSSCTEALNVNPVYIKAVRRRMAAYEKLDELDRALADAKQILDLDPGDYKTRNLAMMWEPIVHERQEKMKEEVLGKLKDLGNSVLGRFGMSLDNFKMDQDPNSGGYSIRFQQ